MEFRFFRDCRPNMDVEYQLILESYNYTLNLKRVILDCAEVFRKASTTMRNSYVGYG